MPLTRTTLLLTFPVLLLACADKEPAVPTDLGTDYFPVQDGRWITYSVDSVWRNDNLALHDSISYQLRELQTEPFTDLGGRAATQLHRQRSNDGATWNTNRVWWQTVSTTQAERSEEDQRRIKLTFPPSNYATWNTNATNSGRSYELSYAEVNVPWSVNGMHFTSTVLVKTTYRNNLVVTNTYYERYAKGVGLVYRQVDSTNTQWNQALQRTHVRGHWYRQTITAYGQ